jgi:hypothetical protein
LTRHLTIRQRRHCHVSEQPRGFPSGTPRKRLTDEQRQTLIGLLETTGSTTEALKQFIEAGHGTVSKVTVCAYAKRVKSTASEPSPR